jgi:hypothetical protein
LEPAEWRSLCVGADFHRGRRCRAAYEHVGAGWPKMFLNKYHVRWLVSQQSVCFPECFFTIKDAFENCNLHWLLLRLNVLRNVSIIQNMVSSCDWFAMKFGNK